MSKQPKDEPAAIDPRIDAEALLQQVTEMTEALQRERADATNLRRRHDEQIAGLRNTIKAGVIRELLPVLDNFELSLKHALPFTEIQAHEMENQEFGDLLKSTQHYIKGIESIVKQFEKTLANMGVERIKTVGEPFDPHLHEAVSMEEGEGSQEVVSEELQSGYKLGDEVIRHAMVRVTTK